MAQSPFGPAQIIYRIEPEQYLVSTSDIDGDGDEDVVVSFGGIGNIFWYESDGAGALSARKPVHSGDVGYTALVSGNLDANVGADVVFALSDPTALHILSNDGNGISFSSVSELLVTATVQSVVLADIDLDADIDLVWTIPENGTIETSLNDGQGVFGAVVIIAEVEGAQHLYAVDFDGDGDEDLACSSSSTGDIAILINAGNGVFPVVSFLGATLESPWWFDVADIRADGDPDIIAPGGGVTWFENMTGVDGFLPRMIPGYTHSDRRAFCSDVNADGQQDMLITYVGEFDQCLVLTVSIGEDDQFTTTTSGYLQCWGDAPAAFADLDGDGTRDLIKVLPFLNRIVWVPSQPSFDEEHLVEGDAFNLVHSLGVADVDMDGDQDILNTPLGARVVWFENSGSGSFALRPGPIWSDAQPNSIEIADLDGDGDPDYLVRNYSDGDIEWARNNGPSGFQYAGLASAVDEWTARFAMGDLDGDGDNDILVSPPSNVWESELYWRANDGNGLFSAPHVVTEDTPNSANLAILDMNGDGVLDIVCPQYITDPGIAIFLATAPGEFPSLPEVTLLGEPNSTLMYAHPGDLDGNGSVDLIGYCVEDGSYSIIPFLNDGTGTLSTGTVIPVSDQTHGEPIITGDFNGDAIVDLIFGAVDCACVRFFPGLGDAEFGSPVLVDSTSYGGAICFQTADLDLDGDLDLITARTNPTKIIWYENSLIAASMDEPGLETLGFAPNPMTDQTHLSIPSSMEKPLRLDVLDGLGKVVQWNIIRDGEAAQIGRRGLTTGLYTVRAVDRNYHTTYGKLMID